MEKASGGRFARTTRMEEFTGCCEGWLPNLCAWMKYLFEDLGDLPPRRGRRILECFIAPDDGALQFGHLENMGAGRI
jgi:hypothetical protein